MNRNIDIVVDATKDLLLNVLKFHPFLIKPNNHELGEMFGVVLKSDDEIVEYAKKLQVMGARNVLISMAGDGAILITETGGSQDRVPKGTVVNSVGAGDSMVAGFTASYLKDHDYMEALKRNSNRKCHSIFRRPCHSGQSRRTLQAVIVKRTCSVVRGNT